MNTNDFYSQILGLKKPWVIETVDVDMDGQQVDIFVSYSSSSAPCQCGDECKIHDRSKVRQWRHLDTCQLITYIHCSLPRTKCHNCKVKTLQAPWAQPHGRFTALFEAAVINWLQVSVNQTKVARQMKLSFDEVNGVMQRAVERGLAKRRIEDVEKLSIDEKSMSKGHNYLTVLSDPVKGRIIEVCESRKESAVKEMLKSCFTPKQLEKVICITMDMWRAFMNAASKTLPNADIVHDRFHIAQYLNKSVDQTRKQENRRLSKEGNYDLKKSKYLFLSNLCNVKKSHQERFIRARKASEKTAQNWEYKELFQNFFSLKSTEEGEEFLENWYRLAIDEDIKPLTKAANTIYRHKKGIVNYLKHRITNAFAESINGRIQELKTRARGFMAFKNYRVNILFHFGKLDLSPIPHNVP